jgi:hypothetical protein
MNWPKTDYDSLCDAFGRFELNEKGEPTERWQRGFLCTFDLPYPMRLSWQPEVIIRKITSNQAVRVSLIECFEDILKLYGSVKAVQEARMDLYGGCYCFRRARGLGTLSLHAWGAAIDLDPDNNALGKKWEKNKGMIPVEVVEIFKKRGAIWGGDWKSRPDPMHFQFTQPY